MLGIERPLPLSHVFSKQSVFGTSSAHRCRSWSHPFRRVQPLLGRSYPSPPLTPPGTSVGHRSSGQPVSPETSQKLVSGTLWPPPRQEPPFWPVCPLVFVQMPQSASSLCHPLTLTQVLSSPPKAKDYFD